MNVAPVLGGLLGVLLAVGIIVAVAAVRGYRPQRPQRRIRSSSPAFNRQLIAVMAGLLLLVLTGWVAVAVGIVGLILAWGPLFGGGREFKAQIAKLEAVATWTELMRDQITTSSSLPEALQLTAQNPPRDIAVPLADFLGRYTHRVPLESSLRRLADDLDDPTSDQVIAALILNSRVRGPALRLVLSQIAAATRADVEHRRTAGIELSRTQRGTMIVVVTSIVGVLGVALAMPAWAATFHDVAGQMVLVVATACFGVGFVVMARLTRWSRQERFVTTREQSW